MRYWYRKYLLAGIKVQILTPGEQMLGDIRSSFETHLETLDWMDGTTREAAVEKLEGMDYQVGCRRVRVSSYYYMCPHTTMYVSSHYYICVLILLYMCPHTTGMDYQVGCRRVLSKSRRVPAAVLAHLLHFFIFLFFSKKTRRLFRVSAYCYMCPHTTMYVSSYYYICVLILLYVSSYSGICVLILLNMCPHTTI